MRSRSVTIVDGIVVDPPHDLVDDLDGSSDLRVVGRHHDTIRMPTRDRAHRGPLLAIPIATAAEHDDQRTRASCDTTGRFEQPLEAVGRVRVVDDDRHAAASALVGLDDLETARDCGQRRNCTDGNVDVDAELDGGRERGQRVRHVEVAADRHLDSSTAPDIAMRGCCHFHLGQVLGAVGHDAELPPDDVAR